MRDTKPLERIKYRYNVSRRTGCWNWTGTVSKWGYAMISVNCRYVRVHKFMWEARNGPVPKGKHLHHKCENRRCINPEHLELVSPREHFDKHPVIALNLNRQGRLLKVCKRGHRLAGDNLLIVSGWRRLCRECALWRGREWKRKQKRKGTT